MDAGCWIEHKMVHAKKMLDMLEARQDAERCESGRWMQERTLDMGHAGNVGQQAGRCTRRRTLQRIVSVTEDAGRCTVRCKRSWQLQRTLERMLNLGLPATEHTGIYRGRCKLQRAEQDTASSTRRWTLDAILHTRRWTADWALDITLDAG